MFAAQRPRSLSKPIIFRLKSQSLPAAIRREPPAAVEQKMPPILSLSAGNAAISRFPYASYPPRPSPRTSSLGRLSAETACWLARLQYMASSEQGLRADPDPARTAEIL